jgi:hypothetical protein
MPTTDTYPERDAFDRLCAEHALHAEWTSAEGFHLEDGWEHHAFRFRFGIGDETLAENVPYRQGLGIDHDPTASDLLAAVLTDAGTVREYRGQDDDAWLDYADECGFPRDAAGMRRARDAFRTCRAWDDLLRERLGDETTDALIDAAQSL